MAEPKPRRDDMGNAQRDQEYEQVQWTNETIINFSPSKRAVNALEPVRARHVSANSLKMFFERHPKIRHRSVYGFKGQWVAFEDARAICKSFHIDRKVINEMEQATAERGFSDTADADNWLNEEKRPKRQKKSNAVRLGISFHVFGSRRLD